MKQIKIGTCVPGTQIKDWMPTLKANGFETIQLYFNNYIEEKNFDELAKRLKESIGDSGIQIAGIGFYCNPIQSEEQRKDLEYCIDHAHLFGTNLVSTFAGAYEGKSVDEAMPKFKEIFGELTKRAADKGLKIAIENCPMHGDWYHTTYNIGFNPKAWEMMFNEVPADNLGLEWEPTHQMVQMIDPIAQLKKWAPKIFHLHGKDATVDWDAIKTFGVMSSEEYIYHRTPGFGDCNWRDIISILHMNDYSGSIDIEGFHDPVYKDDWEMTGQIHGLKYLKWCRGGDFTPNPWR